MYFTTQISLNMACIRLWPSQVSVCVYIVSAVIGQYLVSSVIGQYLVSAVIGQCLVSAVIRQYLVFAVIGQHHAVEGPKKLGTVWTIVRGLEFCRLPFVNKLSSGLGDKLWGFVGFASLTVQRFPVS